MNLREQIKNLLVTLWPKSKLPTEVHSEIINRLATCRLPIEQIDAMLRAHRFECDKAQWSPFPPDVFKRINAVRSNTGVTARVDSTEATIEKEVNEIRWARLTNTRRRDRVKAAIECMDMSELDAFVEGKMAAVVAADKQAEHAANLWAEAKLRRGNSETWTPEKVANCQPARVVLCRCLGIAIDTPAYDPSRKYAAISNPAGTESFRNGALIRS